MKDIAKIGYLLGLIVAIFILMMLTIPEREAWHSLGIANPGHKDLNCTDCHAKAAGSLRQQLQATVKAFWGLRESEVTFGFEDVTNENCLACHDRPNDNHPVFRFNESRFVDARAAIAPQLCGSCHLEHQGKRVTIGTTFCVHCHADLDLLNDPLDVPHVELVNSENWQSCLGCHDFHGNHERDTPRSLDDMIDQKDIEAYFENGPSPYSNTRFYQAKESLDD